jgi:hypothetical protein
MKIYKLLLAITIFTMMSCDKDDDNKSLIMTDFNVSKVNWEELKSINGNSYTYQTTFSSWTGFGAMTELKIRDGIVISRLYEEFQINGANGQKEVLNSYLEEGSDLGSNERGAKILTIDQLYDSCVSKYLIADTKNNTLYFESELGGIMSLCGYVPNGCVDDCFSGVRINSFNWTD